MMVGYGPHNAYDGVLPSLTQKKIEDFHHMANLFTIKEGEWDDWYPPYTKGMNIGAWKAWNDDNNTDEEEAADDKAADREEVEELCALLEFASMNPGETFEQLEDEYRYWLGDMMDEENESD